MKISKNTWHYRIFDWWYQDKHGEHFEESSQSYFGYNLCPYVRSVLFWAPSRFFFEPPVVWGTGPVLTGLILWEIYALFGTKGLLVLWHAVLFLLSLAAFLGVVIVCIAGMEFLKRKFKNKELGPISSFSEILVERMRAAHNRICPQVKFE